MIWIQMIIVLLAILIGTRLKGISLGMMGGLGLAILTFCFHVKPDEPPLEVLLIITAVLTATSSLEAAGGLHYLTTLAERIIRKYPQGITYISPFITYLFTFLGGTGHTVYSILPVIADVAREMGVRPERPLSVSVIAAQQAAIASPISAPTAILVGILAPYGVELIDIMKVCVPATIGGLFVATWVASKLGKELHEDPAYLKRLQEGQQAMQAQAQGPHTVTKSAKRSVILFTLGVALIMLLGAWKGLRPSWEINGELRPMNMAAVIEIMMLAIAALIVLLCNLQPKEIVKGNVFTAGIQAVVAILGISWLGATFVKAHEGAIMTLVQEQITHAPWQFSIILFMMSIILVSQSTTIRIMLPLGISLGLSITALLAAIPAVNGLFFIPNYPTILAAISFDRTGTTRIGKFILNHSFMIPGLVATITAVLISYSIVYFLF